MVRFMRSKLPSIFRRSAEPNSWGGSAHPVIMASVGAAAESASVSLVEAENLAVALACVNVISSNIAAFAVLVYRRQGTERVEVADHWLSRSCGSARTRTRFGVR